MPFTCPHCGSSIRESPKLALQTVACPKCGGHFVHPPIPDSSQDNESSEPPATEPPPADANATNNGGDSAYPRHWEANSRAKSAKRGSIGTAWAPVVIGLSFGVLGMLTLSGTMLFLLTLSAAKSAPQEAAAGAIFAALFIAGYIITRSIEKVVLAVAGDSRK
jgi:Zn-finger nucleic acid-binding protein